jgi:tetratricopeptide (TPR) repeat protein
VWAAARRWQGPLLIDTGALPHTAPREDRDDNTDPTERIAIHPWIDDHPGGDDQRSSSTTETPVATPMENDFADIPTRRLRSGPRQRISPSAGPVFDAVERRLRRERRWEELAALYASALDHEPRPRERSALLKRLADVLDQSIGDVEEAQHALVEALALDPNDEEVAARLHDGAHRTEAGWNALVDAVAAKIEAAQDVVAKTQLAAWVVRWARGSMRDASVADRFVSSIRALDPTHPLVHERMASAYAEVGAWDSRREELERALARAERLTDRAALHLALGQLFEAQLPNEKLALEHFEKAVAIDARTGPALIALERIYRRTEQFGLLANVVSLQVDSLPGRRERTEALLRLGELLERHFLKPREATLKYEAALAGGPGATGAPGGAEVRALDGLERCYHALRDWERLASTLERRAAAGRSRRDAITTLTRLAQVRETKQDRPEAAIAALRRAHELDASHGPTVRELARLCERQHDIQGAAAYRARLADLTDDPREKARIHVGVGEMLAPEGRDPDRAHFHFERAIEMDPRSAPAWENLQKLAVRRGDRMYAVFCLERRADAADSARLKGQLLTDLAAMRASLGDPRGALATYEFAFETDPSNEVAARAVLDEWTSRGQWEDAQRACDLLVAAAARDRDDPTLLKLLRLSTRAALSLGNLDRALLAAGAAHDLAPAEAVTQIDLVEVCHQLRGQPTMRERVRANIDRVARSAMDLPIATLVQIGEARIATGDHRGAIEMLRLALAREGDNRHALAALAGAYLEQGDWASAARCQHTLAQHTTEGAEQRALYLAAAEIWENQARLPARAVAVLEEAHQRNPREAAALHRLVALAQKLGDGERLARALRWLADLEQEPAKRAKHLYATAGVVRDMIGDPGRAANLYEEALDVDASCLEAFERLVRVWTRARDWENLELAYTRMIARVRRRQDTRLLHALYHQLGLLLRDRIGDMPRALAAFRMACAVSPDDDEDQRIVTELLLLMGQVDGAIAELRNAVRSAPDDPTSYRRLYDVHLHRGDHDRAWCTANVLVHLGAADESQRGFVADFPPVDVDDVPGTLAASAWKSHVLAGGLDRRLTAIFRFLIPAVVRARLGRVPARRRLGWLGEQVRDTDSAEAERLVRTVRAAAEVLGVPRPMLLARPRSTLPLSVAPIPTPALYVSMPAVEALPPELLVFLVGCRLAELRPDLIAHALFPTSTELRTLLKTAMRVAVATPSAPPHDRDEAAIAAALEAHELEGLRAAVSTIVGTHAQADVSAWLRWADVSASRAGLLVSGDFDLACRAMQREPRSPSDLAPGERQREMIAFAVGDAYAQLRDAIGVNVESRCG